MAYLSLFIWVEFCPVGLALRLSTKPENLRIWAPTLFLESFERLLSSSFSSLGFRLQIVLHFVTDFLMDAFLRDSIVYVDILNWSK